MEVGTTERLTAGPARAGIQRQGRQRMAKSVAMAVDTIACIEQSADGGSAEIENLKIELSLWRNTYSVGRAKRDCVENKNKEDMFTVAELCSGGCLDTIAALRVGFKLVWSSEIDPAQAHH